MEFTVTHKGTPYHISLPSETTLSALYDHLEELTSVPSDHQKLLYKGKKTSVKADRTLPEAGITSGIKIQMLGPTSEELASMRGAEDEKRRVERIKQERAAKAQTKVESIHSILEPRPIYLRIRIEPLAHLPNSSPARQYLTRLAEDAAILHVMQKHNFSVGLLTELAPHEHPNLLGLNTNAGQSIRLRIRTNAYDGFRPYLDVRRVLCHELTHNVWSDHDNNFKELNSQLNREVAQYERSVKEGTHTLRGDTQGDVYEPSTQLEAEAREYVLGGTHVLVPSSSSASEDESREERRRRILEATMNRLKKEEEELEQSCGSAGPSALN